MGYGEGQSKEWDMVGVIFKWVFLGREEVLQGSGEERERERDKGSEAGENLGGR